jgi:inositol oxygenase
MSAHDEQMFDWVRKFNPYDLYSKGRERPDAKTILPFYEDLIAETFPAQIEW